MVKATWAVACLLCAAILVAGGGCATKKFAEAPPTGAVASIREENVIPAHDPVKSVVEPAAAIPPVAAGIPGKAAVPAGPEYQLGPEDIIKVSVWENRELTLDLVVRPDGKISMPLIQDVHAEGLTAVELAGQIQERLTSFIKEPQVSIIVLQVNAPRYYVIGNVAKPGPYLLRTDTSILQALSLAGGFTPFASIRSIKLIRNTAGRQEIRKINYNDVIDEGGEGNFLLRSGDTIVVP